MRNKYFFSLLLIAGLFIVKPLQSFSSTWSQVNQGGFGIGAQDANVMKVFNNKLYSCSMDSSSGSYKPLLIGYDGGTNWSQVSLSAITSDPKNEYCGDLEVFNNHLILGIDNSDGGEIWAWDAAGTWTQINTNGFGDSDNDWIIKIRVWNGKLYVSTHNKTAGGEIWEYSGAGVTWTQINTNGFGDSQNAEVHVFEANNKLYATTDNRNTGSEVWEYSGAGTSWTQINTPGYGDGAICFDSFLAGNNNALYAGTRVSSGSAKAWQYSGSGSTWTRVNTDGFGDLKNHTITLFSLNSQLYATTRNNITGAEVWLYSGSGTTWTQQNSDGFGDKDNQRIQSMILFQNTIYAGTTNFNTGAEVWATSTQGTPTATITGNSGSGQLNITTSDTLSVKVTLNAGGVTTNSDWWCVYSDPANQWSYLDLASSMFQSGLVSTYQGALFDLGSYQVFNSTLSPPGTYTFYFGVDTTPDGSVTLNSAYYDTLVVNVQ